MTSSYAPVEEVYHHQPYTYQYGVKDDYSKANFAKTESQDAQVNWIEIFLKQINYIYVIFVQNQKTISFQSATTLFYQHKC